MTTRHDDRIDAYLWDPTATPAPEVQAVERRLEPLRLTTEFRAAASVRRRRRWPLVLAAAAAMLVATGASVWIWRLSWPESRPWTLASTSASAPDRLAVGAPFELSPADRADVDIARIGTMAVGGDSRVTLLSTQGTRHRLSLDRGTVRVRIWAPPNSVVFRTPAGEVIDLGCEFELTAGADRTHVRVLSGWVQIENTIQESLIPAGASGEMRPGRPPSIPVFDDAPPALAAAVRAIERGDGDASAHAATIAATARLRDVYTLLMIVDRGLPGRERVAVRAAELAPPPDDVTVNGVLRGDRDALWHWRDTLLLPPAKSWLRNWRDALPRWLAPSR
jgi:hypothetical protein